MIAFKNVTLEYSDQMRALEQIDFEIKPGDLVFITGPSGSGKTSLLKLMMGMEKATRGTVMVDNLDVAGLKGNALSEIRRNMGPIFQDFKLLKGKNALENVKLGIRFYGMRNQEMNVLAINALKSVGLEEKIYQKVETLSWGESQRVAIARAVCRAPKYIIADEPTGNLDHENAVKILAQLIQFRNKKTAVIITTHATHLIEGTENATWIQMAKGVATITSTGGSV